MSTSSKGTNVNRSDIELRGVGSRGAGNICQHQNERSPFLTHNCALEGSHGADIIPVSGFDKHSTTYPLNPLNLGVGNPERIDSEAIQTEQESCSNSSLRKQSEPALYLHDRDDWPHPPNEYVNDMDVTLDTNAYASGRWTGIDDKTDRGMSNPRMPIIQAEYAASNNGTSFNSGRNKDNRVRTTIPEDSSYRPYYGPDFIDGELDDKRIGTSMNNESDYERLHRGRSSSQHVYRPIADHSSKRPMLPSTNLNPSKFHGARPPPYTTGVVTESVNHTGHETRHSKQQLSKNARHTNDADDIVELQSDVRGSKSPEEKQNESNAREDQPQMREVPNTNFAIACMVTLCFNLPFGVLAMYFSLRAVKAYQNGRAKLGEQRSRWSIVFSLLGITITTVIISSVVLFIAMQGQKRISRNKAYGTRSGLNL